MTLVNAIRANDPCTIPVFYQTWGRLDGDSQFCGQLPDVCTYEGMQDRLTESYTTFASTNKPASVAPVGEAFRASAKDRQSLYSGNIVFNCILNKINPIIIRTQVTDLTHPVKEPI